MVLKLISWISKRENITFLIAVVGFGLSIFNFVENRISNRKKLNFSIEYTYNEAEYLFLVTTITNCSRIPITLTSGKFIIHGQEHRIGKQRLTLFTYLYPEKRGKQTEQSEVFPIKIEGLDYIRCLFATDEFPINQPTQCNIHLETNRGSIKLKEIFPAPIDSLKELLQYLK